MKKFMDSNFLLQTETAQELYHAYAEPMPIIDFHCHLPQQDIADDRNFDNLTQVWLYGDHYKWRAMRTNGVPERFCTGDATDWEKFQMWAKTVPYTMRNPLYHWTHLELQRYFDIHELLDENSAKRIYDECSEKLRSPEYSVRNLLRKMNVNAVFTTDDPADDLHFHKKIKADKFEITVLPAFRPDASMDVSSPSAFNAYVTKVESASDISCDNFKSYLNALKQRHTYFDSMGCRLSDHGLNQIFNEPFTDAEIEQIFGKIRSGKSLDITEERKFKSAMLTAFAAWDAESGWVQQFHLGALRNNNSKLLSQLGPDTGWDSIGDFNQAEPLSSFLNKMSVDNHLGKTVIYNLNPADNELFATMIGNFNDGSLPGKIQYGSAWWFLDQKDGMTKQMNALSNMGLLSRFIGMLTDSRSFLSYPRHEYFRRILCNLFGQDVEAGELPNNVERIGKIIQDICFYNAKNYFSL